MDSLERLNKVARGREPTNLRPRDAASLVIVDRAGGTLRVLLGRRNAQQRFVPDKYVFPGGRVEASDSRVRIGTELGARETARLLVDMKGRPTPARARALAMAAVRETFEETGLLIGKPAEAPAVTRAPAWRPFLAHGAVPRLDCLTFVARAVTPPRRPRRYDTRFFLVFAEHILSRAGDGDGEFSDLQWVTFEEARAFDLHAMTRTVLDDVAERLERDPELAEAAPVPYYYSRNGIFVRKLIDG